MKTSILHIPTRIAHALFAIGILTNLFLIEDDPWHQYIGYSVVGLIAFRLIWGFIDKQTIPLLRTYPKISRFKALWNSLLNEPLDDPRGQAAIKGMTHWIFCALLFIFIACIATLGTTGFLLEEMTDAPHFLKEIHEVAANTMIPCAVLHIFLGLFRRYPSKFQGLTDMMSSRKHIHE